MVHRGFGLLSRGPIPVLWSSERSPQNMFSFADDPQPASLVRSSHSSYLILRTYAADCGTCTYLLYETGMKTKVPLLHVLHDTA